MQSPRSTDPIEIEDDLDEGTFEELLESGIDRGLAIDLETTGLDPVRDSIQVISVTGSFETYVLVTGIEPPSRLARLLNDQRVSVIAHNALFDLSFMRHHWQVETGPVFCTKVAARIARIDRNPHLADLVEQFLEIPLDKSPRLSDWSERPLTPAQVHYAANDVRYLHYLKTELSQTLADRGQTELFAELMRFLPARVSLDLLALGDVFAYRI